MSDHEKWNGLNWSFETQRLSNRVSKYRLAICCIQRTHLKCYDTKRCGLDLLLLSPHLYPDWGGDGEITLHLQSAESVDKWWWMFTDPVI